MIDAYKRFVNVLKSSANMRVASTGLVVVAGAGMGAVLTHQVVAKPWLVQKELSDIAMEHGERVTLEDGSHQYTLTHPETGSVLIYTDAGRDGLGGFLGEKAKGDSLEVRFNGEGVFFDIHATDDLDNISPTPKSVSIVYANGYVNSLDDPNSTSSRMKREMGGLAYRMTKTDFADFGVHK